MPTRSNRVIVAIILMPLGLLAFVQNCSPMQAVSKNRSSSLQFSSDICASQYAPNNSLFLSKVQDTVPLSHFEKKKNQLEKANGVSAKATSLLSSQILVTLNSKCTPKVGSLSSRVQAQNSGDSTARFSRKAYPYTVPDDIDSAALGEQAEQDPCVLGLTKDGTMTTSAMLVNDPQAQNQTHLQEDFSHTYEYLIEQQSSSTKVKVGFVDTGADCSHSDLLANLASNCGFDAINSLTPTDNDGHGSHTMGITGAVMNNGIGVTGMAGNSIELHAIRVIDVGTGSVADAYEGIQYAIQQNLDVINISLQSQARLALIEQGVQEAVAAGIVVIMAAGNHGSELGLDIDVSPALIGKSLNGAITVGSIDASSGLLSSFSNYGDKVEILAIGANNSNLASNGDGGLLSLDKNNGYQRLMGTSQSAPIVTAAAALAIQFFKQRSVSYTPADIEQILLASTTQIGGISAANGGLALNTTKLVRSIYAFAGQALCGDGN